jgi:hypothetical protein
MFENPKDRYFVTLGVIVGFFGIFLSMIMTLMTGKWQGMLIPGIPGVIVILRIWQVEICHRPERITINGKGVIIQFRNARRKEVDWSSIRDIYSHPGPAWTISGRGIGRGGFRVNGETMSYNTSYEIAEAMVRQYTASMGRPPEEWDGASR